MVPPWPRPRIHASSKPERKRIIKLLYDQGILEPTSEQHMWSFRGELVTSGMFGVGKAKKKLIMKADGSSGEQQRLIINLIPPNSLHADIELGKNDLLPSEGQINAVYMLPLQRLLMSARDRKCFSTFS